MKKLVLILLLLKVAFWTLLFIQELIDIYLLVSAI